MIFVYFSLIPRNSLYYFPFFFHVRLPVLIVRSFLSYVGQLSRTVPLWYNLMLSLRPCSKRLLSWLEYFQQHLFASQGSLSSDLEWFNLVLILLPFLCPSTLLSHLSH